jgi:acyl dehydratase
MSTAADSATTWAPGSVLPAFEDTPLTVTDFVRYQGASGDFTAFHHDEAAARASGYPSVFSVGMLAAGILGTYVAELFGPGSVRKFGVRFQEQAWPGDVLTYGGTVTESRRTEEGTELTLELSANRRGGSAHLIGWATVLLDQPSTS